MALTELTGWSNMSDVAAAVLNLGSLILLATITANYQQEHSFAALSVIKEAGEWR